MLSYSKQKNHKKKQKSDPLNFFNWTGFLCIHYLIEFKILMFYVYSGLFELIW